MSGSHRKPEPECTGPEEKCTHVDELHPTMTYPHCGKTYCKNFIGRCKKHGREFGN